jgi:hypothetical protein
LIPTLLALNQVSRNRTKNLNPLHLPPKLQIESTQPSVRRSVSASDLLAP